MSLRSPHRMTVPAALAAAALAACGGAAEAGPRPPGGSETTPVLATLAPGAGAGTELLRGGDLAGARVAFESALGADPDRVAALNDLAVSYYLEGRFESARQILDEVVARGGPVEQQAALVNLGELYALDGYLDAAQAHFESARGIDPGRPGPLYALALLADARGDRSGALALAGEALRLDDGRGRSGLAFAYPEERVHLEALLGEAQGDRGAALARWRELGAGRFPALAAAARRHLEAATQEP